MWRHVTKANLAFLIGVAGFAHEVVVQEQERPYVLAACCAFAGLKFVLRADDKLRGNDKGTT